MTTRASVQIPINLALTTSLQSLGAAVPVSQEASDSIIFSNSNSADQYVTLNAYNAAANPTTVNAVTNMKVPTQDAKTFNDTLPAGWTWQVLASVANAVGAKLSRKLRNQPA